MMMSDLVPVGMRAPPLDVPDLNGRPRGLRELRGKPVLVIFLRHAG